MTLSQAPGTGAAIATLRRMMQRADRPRPGECCDMCGEPITASHSHVADTADHRLLCTCRGCYLLFTQQGAGSSRRKAVPEQCRAVPDFALAQELWDAMALPVDLVFLLAQTGPDGIALGAYYPSPAGATESELDLAAWSDVAAAYPMLGAVEADVEAVLIRRQANGEFTCLVVPVDVCYELVGIVRQGWTGLSGGAEVWQRIEAFFADLCDRCVTT